MVAFSDRPWPRRKIGGRWYQSMPLGQLHAIGERRMTAPAPDDQELRHQHHVVTVLAAAQTVLPVRFGAQTTRAALLRLVGPHEETLRRGLEEVRDKVQMNVRFSGTPLRPAAVPVAAASGREYLERRRASAASPLSPSATAFLAALERVAARQRIETGSGSLIATAYHLVPHDQLNRYLEVSGDAQRVGALVTGPFPPFAFTPAIL